MKSQIFSQLSIPKTQSMGTKIGRLNLLLNQESTNHFSINDLSDNRIMKIKLDALAEIMKPNKKSILKNSKTQKYENSNIYSRKGRIVKSNNNFFKVSDDHLVFTETADGEKNITKTSNKELSMNYSNKSLVFLTSNSSKKKIETFKKGQLKKFTTDMLLWGKKSRNNQMSEFRNLRSYNSKNELGSKRKASSYQKEITNVFASTQKLNTLQSDILNQETQRILRFEEEKKKKEKFMKELDNIKPVNFSNFKSDKFLRKTVKKFINVTEKTLVNSYLKENEKYSHIKNKVNTRDTVTSAKINSKEKKIIQDCDERITFSKTVRNKEIMTSLIDNKKIKESKVKLKRGINHEFDEELAKECIDSYQNNAFVYGQNQGHYLAHSKFFSSRYNLNKNAYGVN